MDWIERARQEGYDAGMECWRLMLGKLVAWVEGRRLTLDDYVLPDEAQKARALWQEAKAMLEANNPSSGG